MCVLWRPNVGEGVQLRAAAPPLPRNLKRMTSYVVLVQIIVKVSLAPSVLVSKDFEV